MWQKALILEHPDYDKRQWGKMLWVKGGSLELPDYHWHQTPEGKFQWVDRPMYSTNLLDDEGNLACIDACCLKLLPEFADVVPLTPWEEILKCA